MGVDGLFRISILMSFVAFGLVAKLYIWPRLRRRGREDALLALLMPHAFRFVGLSFLVPGVVSPSLPRAFAVPAAYGDLIAAILAIAAAIPLSSHRPWAIWLVWPFNLWGAADLLFAFYQGLRLEVDPSTLGAAFVIPTAIVPPLLVTHGLVFALLVRSKQNHIIDPAVRSPVA